MKVNARESTYCSEVHFLPWQLGQMGDIALTEALVFEISIKFVDVTGRVGWVDVAMCYQLVTSTVATNWSLLRQRSRKSETGRIAAPCWLAVTTLLASVQRKPSAIRVQGHALNRCTYKRNGMWQFWSEDLLFETSPSTAACLYTATFMWSLFRVRNAVYYVSSLSHFALVCYWM
jgi:hypothetical protein